MSACSPNCPVVRKQLREIVKGAPWISKKEISENEESLITPADAVGKKRSPYPDHREERESVIKGSILKKEAPEDEELLDAPLGSATKKRLDVEHQNLAQSKTKSTVTHKGKVEAAISAARRGSPDATGRNSVDATGRSSLDATGRNSLDAAGIERGTNVNRQSFGHSGARYSQTSKGVSVKDSTMNAESAKATASRGLETSSNIPTTSGTSDRRTKSPGGSREIEEDRKLKKGRVGESNDFDFIDQTDGGICTCTAHCIFRALRNNPFARSILMSTLIFTVGLKLCSEMEGWSMPVEF